MFKEIDKVANEVADIVLDMEMTVVTSLVMGDSDSGKEEAEVEQGLDMEYGHWDTGHLRFSNGLSAWRAWKTKSCRSKDSKGNKLEVGA